MTEDPSAESDPLLAALDELVATARDNIIVWVRIMGRVDEIRELRRRGTPYSDMSLRADGPTIIDAVTGNQERLTATAAQYRRAAVRQLHAEGMRPAEIARAFGVSRQRIAALLSDDAGNE